MAHERHQPLFHARLVRERMATLDRTLFTTHRPAVDVWLEHLRSGALDEATEVSLHGGFLERIFGDVLGYATWATARDGQWELVAEKSVVAGGAADGAIGRFAAGQSLVVAPIELKGARQFLDHARGRALTPVQQGWDYANKTPSSRWILVSNYRETRLYEKGSGQAAYELFRLEDLAAEAGFLRFVALLGRDALLGGPSPDRSPLVDMLLASQRTERDITARLYADYRRLRARLFDELRRVHSNIPPAELLAHAQTILDRVLFVAFAEDRGLLRRDTLARAYEHKDPYHPQPVWRNFVAVFHSVDQGNPLLEIPAYNGGLFRPNSDLDELQISDDMCRAFKDLGDYDFAEDVSVDVLGHIFEQSVSDLQQLRAEAEASIAGPRAVAQVTDTQKQPSKRRLEGIFYTPPFVTDYLVRETLGAAIREAWERASAGRGPSRTEQIATWRAYQQALRAIRVLDPACGSGAFLVAAFDLLAQEFDRTNRVLAELHNHQIDLFETTRTVLNENLFGIDKSGESVEITKLSLWLKTAEWGRRLTFLDRNIRQGNSVVSDPLLDPWAFDWQAGRVAQSFLEPEPPQGEETTAIDARWREGFDVVIGNPPYVRQELLSAYKDHWKTRYQAYDGTADLFVYFFERGLQQLKPGGRLGFIVSNKWLRGGYAARLRALFRRECTVETLVDFGHAPIFPDADAFPCIITLRKATPPPDHTVRVTTYPREELGRELLATYVATHQFPLPQRTLREDGWSLERPEVAALLAKLRERGVPLGEYAKTKPFYGIKTGCNEAFLVDTATKERLCREDPRSAELLKKYLRGQDIARWAPEWAGKWMIFARRGVDIDRYPAIKAHLETYRAALEPRPRDYTGRDWPGRKPGNYRWYEIQDAVDYYRMFDAPCLCYSDIMWRPDFCLSVGGTYTNNTVYALPSDDPWLLACLNSPALWSFMWRTAQHAKDEALRMFGDFVVTLPIAQPSAAQREQVASWVREAVERTSTAQSAAAAVLDLLRMEYGVESPGQALADFAALDSDAFVREVRKRRPKGAVLSPAGLRALRALYTDEVPPILAQRAQIQEHERVIAAAVHAAYGLTPDDLALLKATAPPRMPPGL